jgi:hypothetical protein
VFAYGLETKMQSSKWHTSSSPRPKKSRAEKYNFKVMLVEFFDDEGIVHREFVPTGTSVTAAFYVDVLTRLSESGRRKRPQNWKNDWALHHDNAPSHMAMAVGSSWQKTTFRMCHTRPIPQIPAPSDFWLFPTLKMGLRGRRFVTVEDIKGNADARLRTIKRIQ